MKKDKIYIVLAILIMAIGFITRIKLFISARPLWHDECSLAINILTRNPFQFLSPLDHLQSAPPIFMGITKIFTYIFKTNEFSLRIIPFLSSLLSIPIFFLLSQKIFKTRYTQLIATFLFTFNYRLIYYSQEFKQYSSDVFITLLCIYWLSNKNLKDLSLRKTFLYGIIFCIIPLLSVPSTFVFITFIITQLFYYKKEILKKIFAISILPIISGLLYAITTVFNSNSNLSFLKNYFGTEGFIGLNPISWIINFKVNLNYFFYPNKLILFAIILTVLGLILTIKNTRNKTQNMLLGTLCIGILFSLIQIYPIFERTCLYLIPSILLILLTPIDYIKWDKPLKNISIGIITLIYFIGYNPKYFSNLFKTETHTNEYAREAMLDIISRYTNDEIIVYNTASDSEYLFYTKYFKFSPLNNIRLNLQTDNQTEYDKILNQLPKNKTYWFYFPYSLSKYPENYMLKTWSKNKTVLFEKDYKTSLIMQVKL